MSSRPAARAVDRDRGAAREGDHAGEAQRAVSGQVGLGDQETCAGTQQHDAQEDHGSQAIVAPGDRGSPLRLPACPPRSCRPPGGRCSAPATASACAHAPPRACAARGARASAWSPITVALAPSVDPTAVAFASRRRGEDWFCFEHPDRDGAALATSVRAAALDDRGAGRFGARRRALARAAGAPTADAPDGPPGAGLVAVGGFAFAPDGGDAAALGRLRRRRRCTCPRSRSRAAASDVTLTLAARRRARRRRRARSPGGCSSARASLRSAPLPLLDPDPTGRYRVVSAMPPEHYESAVARAVERIRAGALDKIVLAREVAGPRAARARRRGGARRPARGVPVVLHLLRRARRERVRRRHRPSCSCAATACAPPPLALAGSTRRSADPAVDDHLGEQLLRSDKDREEQAIVTRRIVRALRPLSVWVTAAEEPVVARMANIQHLATPIRAQLARPVSAVELAGLLHPTPAVGGEPFAAAGAAHPGARGPRPRLVRGARWGGRTPTRTASSASRCAARCCTGAVARCYAGVGVVRDSDPAAELAETEVKLQALLPVLAG